MMIESSLTVLFEEPFWIGLYERSYGKNYEVCKITFGAEPKENEVYNFLLANWSKLRFASELSANDYKRLSQKHQNPKRIQRQINKQLQTKTLSTKAQLALQQQREEKKQERQVKNKTAKIAEQEYKFALRQAKKKAKHRGR